MATNRIISVDLSAAKKRVLEVLGGVSSEDASKRVRRAYEAGFSDGNDDPQSGTIAAGGFGYQSLGTGSGARDFSKLDPDTIRENVWSLYMSNPVADRALEIKRDHIVGRGIRPQVDDEDVQEIINKAWEDNQLRQRSKEFTLQLFLLGEQCYPVFVRETDGRVRLGYIDPGQIEQVVQHPDNALEMWAVVIKEQRGRAWEPFQKRRVYRIIRRDETFADENEVRASRHEGMLVTHGQATLEPWEEKMLRHYELSEYSGSCFYHKVNSLSNQPRGWSDLLRVIDWSDQHDATLFDMADFLQMVSYFVWEIIMEGNDDDVQKRAKEIRNNPPAKGSVNVHNTGEEWNLVSPQRSELPNINAAESLFNQIWGGLGYPNHWFTKGDTSNRSTSENQGAPTWRTLEHDQDIIRDMFVEILAFVRDQAIIAGTLSTSAMDATIDMVMPEMTTKDLNIIGQAMVAIANALTLAVSQGWISRQTATEAWARVMNELGMEIDPNEEIDGADSEEADDLEQMMSSISRMLNERLNSVGQNGGSGESEGE